MCANSKLSFTNHTRNEIDFVVEPLGLRYRFIDAETLVLSVEGGDDSTSVSVFYFAGRIEAYVDGQFTDTVVFRGGEIVEYETNLQVGIRFIQ